MDVIIVCHTEFGFVHRRQAIPDKNAREGVTQGVARLAEIADDCGAKVTFAVCPEVAPYFPTGLKHEIGLHVHPGWIGTEYKGFKYHVGDEYLRQYCCGSVNSTVLQDYPYADQITLIRRGKERLRECLGVDATSFVSGRWSVNNDTVRALIEVGISHECSALPGSKPRHNDWSRLPRICMPYHPQRGDYQQSGDCPLLIIPVSEGLGGVAMNPELVPLFGLSWFKACFAEYSSLDLPLFHICLHSPAMTDEYFCSAMRELLSHIARHRGVRFKFASEIGEYPAVKAHTRLLPYLCGVNPSILATALKARVLHRHV
jgi:hypothetical protein